MSEELLKNIPLILSGLSLAVSIISLIVSWWYPSRTRKKEMIDGIYGPLFIEFNSIVKSLQEYADFEEQQRQHLVEMADNYLFFKIEKGLRDRIESFQKNLQTYKVLYRVAEGVIDTAISVVNKELFKELNKSGGIRYRLLAEDQLIEDVWLHEALLKGKTPRQILSKYVFSETQLEIWMCGGSTKAEDDKHKAIDKLCQLILEKTQKEAPIQNMRKQNQILVEKANHIIEELNCQL